MAAFDDVRALIDAGMPEAEAVVQVARGLLAGQPQRFFLRTAVDGRVLQTLESKNEPPARANGETWIEITGWPVDHRGEDWLSKRVFPDRRIEAAGPRGPA